MSKPRLTNPRHFHLRYKRVFPATGDRLWAYRNSLNMTQKDLGDECNLSGGCISRIECGYTLGMGRTLVKIAKGLGISIDYLCNLSDEEKLSTTTNAKDSTWTKRHVSTSRRAK